jgi:hypothetical protein
MRTKCVTAGKWWEIQTTKPLTTVEIKGLASRLARGETITQVAQGDKGYHQTPFYYRWMVWKSQHPEIGRRLLKLSKENKAAKVIATHQAKAALRQTAWVAVPPPNDMWAMINAAVPQNLFGELRGEVCQRLALDVLERRCECTVAGLRRALTDHRRAYYREYANPWGDKSLDQKLSDDSKLTRLDTIKRGLWD